ncbi:MAG: hypothetical protein KDM91_19885 [Verrucomicrobiae bacterium]|nr:hypothetical protein [Verrucomicrobiae bacterium]MCP5539626.1 hypothetical protein [Akkermansiaceae bacterium]MCP5549364.1 hypothetical protein [Akkermansiaceae bacterium]
MQKIRFDEAVKVIRRRDGRFDADAYAFLRDALDYTVRKLRSEEMEEHRHVNGGELLHGFRDYALREYGPMAATVLESWGLGRCEDVGDMVFQLIEAGVFGKSDEDCPADFAGVFDFDEAFRQPFRPKIRQNTPAGDLSASGGTALRSRGLKPKPADEPGGESEAAQESLN